MAGRRAVAASIAASVIFSSVLISNFVLISAEQQKLGLVSVATEERKIYDQALVVRSVSLLDLLDRMQDALSSSSFQCSSATSSISKLASSEVIRVGWGGVSANASLSEGGQETIVDDLSTMLPFNGSQDGSTNFEANVSLLGASPDASVVYRAAESDRINLPLKLPRLVSLCLQATSQFASGMDGLGPQLCNATLVGGLMASSAEQVSASATASGFSFASYYSLVSYPACQVSFTVLFTQGSIDGPEGPFSFSAEEGGTVSWPPQSYPA